MKIIYKQPDNDGISSLYRLGVRKCYFKKIVPEQDGGNITKKEHHHTGFEIHIVTNGLHTYEVGNKKYELENGDFLLLPPKTVHRVVQTASFSEKYTITFDLEKRRAIDCFQGRLTTRMSENIEFIVREASQKKEISVMLIENCITEIIVSIFRTMGVKEKEQMERRDENAVVSLAKQYINDNIERVISVDEVSDYCRLSTKQLTRIFNGFENITAGEYIKKQRIEKIERLLADDSLSLKQISDMMGFNNEYYFNAFFKKHSGMPPGEYRKMLGKK